MDSWGEIDLWLLPRANVLAEEAAAILLDSDWLRQADAFATRRAAENKIVGLSHASLLAHSHL
jgi:hypothetical protein